MEKWTRALYQPGLPLGEDGRRVTASPAHIALSREAAREGMVLLKNEDGTLPLKKGTKVALFGKATFDYVKGGGGSGDVTVPYTRNLYEGFACLNYVEVFEPLADFYRGYVEEQYRNGAAPGKPSEPAVPEELRKQAAEYADTAIVSICRFSGEGADRPKEDFYLTEEETAMVDSVKESFAHVIAVLNVGGAISAEWFREEPRIQAALLAWQGGIEGGLAAAELLCGIGNPSGKLADTFAKEIEDYPSTANFEESDDYVEYTEGIYVGYRYFETIPGAADRVAYPFGYGLSYTTFDIRCLKAIVCSYSELEFLLSVKNTGTASGREVVQLYAEVPGKKIENPARKLVDFAKTPELAPGESCTFCLKAGFDTLSSYDETGVIRKSAWAVEAGEYHFYVGNSVRSAEELIFTGESAVILETESCDELNNCGPGSWDVENGHIILLLDVVTGVCSQKMTPRKDLEENPSGLRPLKWEEMECVIPAVRGRERRCFLLKEEPVPQLKDVYQGTVSLQQFVKSLPDQALAELLGGQPNTGVANTYGVGNLPRYGVPNIMTADGPAGLRIEKRCGVTTTAWPCATMLACSWNPELVSAVGQAAAEEVKENNIGIWLAPAVNIHRNPLCGRNFEYYSEDPLLAGRIGAGMVRGIQSRNIAATVKHFALNNKEQNRKESDSRASERAIREIYLKVFEIIVKEAEPWAIMSSYNIINGVRASERKDMLTDILRGEWGYKGLVMTDWWAFSEQYKEILAGNDLKMGCGYPERLLEAMEKGLIAREDLERSATRVLELILKID